MLETIRDIAIIIVAVLAIVLLTLLSMLAFLTYRLFVKFKDDVPALLDTAKSTATSVKGTAEFTGETIVTPLIRLMALLAAVSRFFSVLFGGQRKRVP